MRQGGDDAEELRGGPQDCGFAGFLIRRSFQGPGLFGSQIFVRCRDDAPNRFESSGEFESFVALEDFADGVLGFFGKDIILRENVARFRDFAGEILLRALRRCGLQDCRDRWRGRCCNG